jgi:hypothetical protein
MFSFTEDPALQLQDALARLERVAAQRYHPWTMRRIAAIARSLHASSQEDGRRLSLRILARALHDAFKGCASGHLIEAIDGQAGTLVIRKDALALACRAICAESPQEGMRLVQELKRTRSGVSIEMVHERYAQLAHDADETEREIERRERRLQRLLAARRRHVRMRQPTVQMSMIEL